MFTIQRAIYTIKGDNSKCIFFFGHIKTLTFCNIYVIMEDIYLKFGVCVHFQNSNPCYQGRQFKIPSECILKYVPKICCGHIRNQFQGIRLVFNISKQTESLHECFRIPHDFSPIRGG